MLSVVSLRKSEFPLVTLINYSFRRFKRKLSEDFAKAANILYGDTDILVTQSEHINLFEDYRTFADILCDLLY